MQFGGLAQILLFEVGRRGGFPSRRYKAFVIITVPLAPHTLSGRATPCSAALVFRRYGDKFLKSFDSLDFPLDLAHDFAGIRNKVVA